MKNSILILAVFGLVILLGCEKKTEPTVQSATDVSQSVKETTEQTTKQAEATVAAATEQTTCPVMEGNPINKELFVEYKGKKVYFCCPSCIPEFNKDPEKYVSKLPQFKQ